jgi:hypothetical protein
MLCKTLWPSGLRRWLKAPVRKGVGSNPTGVMIYIVLALWRSLRRNITWCCRAFSAKARCPIVCSNYVPWAFSCALNICVPPETFQMKAALGLPFQFDNSRVK